MSFIKLFFLLLFVGVNTLMASKESLEGQGADKPHPLFLQTSCQNFSSTQLSYTNIQTPQELWDLWKQRLSPNRWPVQMNRLSEGQCYRMLNETTFIPDILKMLINHVFHMPEKVHGEATTLAKNILSVSYSKFWSHFKSVQKEAEATNPFLFNAVLQIEHRMLSLMGLEIPADLKGSAFSPLEKQLYEHHMRLPALKEITTHMDAFQMMGLYGGLFDCSKDENRADISKNFLDIQHILWRPLETHESFINMAFYHANNPYFPAGYSLGVVLDVLDENIGPLLSQTTGQGSERFVVKSLEDFVQNQKQFIDLVQLLLDELQQKQIPLQTFNQEIDDYIDSHDDVSKELWSLPQVTPANVIILSHRYELALLKLEFLRGKVVFKSLDKLKDCVELLLDPACLNKDMCFSRLQGIIETTDFLYREYSKLFENITSEYINFQAMNKRNNIS